MTIDHQKEGHKKTRILMLTAVPPPAPRPDGLAVEASDGERERGYAQPSAPSAPSAWPDARSANPDEIGDAAFAAASDMRTVVRTISPDDASTVRRPSAEHPQAEVGNHANSRAGADGADGADGLLYTLSRSPFPCERPTNCARRTLANGRTACGLCDTPHPTGGQPSATRANVASGEVGA